MILTKAQADALAQMLAAYNGKEPPVPLTELEGQSNNKKFNVLLNNCQHPRAVYDALEAFAEAGKASVA